MAKLTMPPVKAGCLRDLLSALHDLHAQAGWPSVRDLAKGHPFSRALVHELFTVARVPKATVLLPVVETLAKLAPRSNPEALLDRFDELWREAHVEALPVARDRPLMSIQAYKGGTLCMRLSPQHSELLELLEALRQKRFMEPPEVAQGVERVLLAGRRSAKNDGSSRTAVSVDELTGALTARTVISTELTAALLVLYDASAEETVRAMGLQGKVTEQLKRLESVAADLEVGRPTTWPAGFLS